MDRRPSTIQIPGGKLWTRTPDRSVIDYESDDKNYLIQVCKNSVILASFIHEPDLGEDFKRWLFKTLKAAMTFAETI